jgi:phosphoribosylglycinamide formyltransferase-1
MLNIHPSLLPLFPGLHTHEAALAAGHAQHGATVHFVTAELDHGPMVDQATVPVLPGDTPDTLAARLLVQEHVLYPRAIRWFIEDKLVVEDGQVYGPHRPRTSPATASAQSSAQSSPASAN